METKPAGRTLRIETDTAMTEAWWPGLVRLGGCGALFAAALYLAALVVVVASPPAPAAGGAAVLQYIAANRTVYILQQVLWLLPGALLMVTFVALYLALRGVSRTWAAVGGLVGIVSWALTLVYPATGGGAPALVYLSDQYVATADSAQQALYSAAAEGLIAQNVVPTAFGILEPIGILIMSLVALRGKLPRAVAYLGILTGALGIVGETLRPVLGAAYAVYGLLLLAWFLAIGWALVRRGRSG